MSNDASFSQRFNPHLVDQPQYSMMCASSFECANLLHILAFKPDTHTRMGCAFRCRCRSYTVNSATSQYGCSVNVFLYLRMSFADGCRSQRRTSRRISHGGDDGVSGKKRRKASFSRRAFFFSTEVFSSGTCFLCKPMMKNLIRAVAFTQVRTSLQSTAL